MDLTAYRSEFPILERTTYLNSCSLGALSHRAEGRLREFLDLWHSKGASAWYEHWMGRVQELRRTMAGFLGASTAEMALLPSTSAALSTLAESVDYGTRNRVVCTDLDFPTLVYQWTVKPEVEVVLLRSPDGIRIDPEQFEEVVDERTAFLATSHVYFSTGHVQDISTLADIAHSAGALCLVDGYQAAGQIPVELGTSGVDAYTAGPLKWLCGGPGLAYLYVRDELIPRLEPRITSWFATQNQFSFDLEGFQYHDDAQRFNLGTPALPTLHTALGGQEIIDEVGIETIAARNRVLSGRLLEGCLDKGMELTLPEPDHRSAIVMVQHTDPAGAVRHLAAHDIIVDHRPGHVRVSPHFYNSEGEVDRLVSVLAQYRTP